MRAGCVKPIPTGLGKAREPAAAAGPVLLVQFAIDRTTMPSLRCLKASWWTSSGTRDSRPAARARLRSPEDWIKVKNRKHLAIERVKDAFS
jgi:hypothetical protein